MPLLTVLSGWWKSVEITWPWSSSTSRGKCFYKGLDIKIVQFWHIPHIGLDFRYTARLHANLTFPHSFLRKIQKTSKIPSKLPQLTVPVPHQSTFKFIRFSASYVGANRCRRRCGPILCAIICILSGKDGHNFGISVAPYSIDTFFVSSFESIIDTNFSNF